jgi:hypothetical protein
LILWAFRQLNGSVKSSAGGDSYQYAFFSCNGLSCSKGSFVFYRDDFIIDFRIENIWDKTCADALNLMRAGYSLG